MKTIGYLVSQYPATSHTFIRREVEALRRRGLSIDTFSVRTPEARDRLGQADRDERDRTFYILSGKRGGMFLAHVWALWHRPERYFSTLVLSLRHRVPGVRHLLWALFYFSEALVLAKELSRRAVGHLHTHFANAGGNVGMFACHFLGLDFSLTLHGTSEFDYPAGLLLARKLARVRFAACVSSFGMAQAMRAADPRDWEKLLIVRCGIDLKALPAASPAEPGAPRVVCVGRLSPEKGHLGLLDAFAQVIRRGHPAELRLIGDGPDRPRIEAAIVARGLAGRCVLLGQRPENETLAEVAHAQLLVSASLMEGLPVVLMEALAMGIAVVAPRVAGIPELVEDGVTGLLFTPADWAGLATCLERALGDPALRDRLARAGQEKIRAEFDVDRACEPLYRQFARDRLAPKDSLPAPTPIPPIPLIPPLPGPPERGSG
jgi:colanic acid/amylovoran biosynthesis glycosyltransferase